MGLGKALGSSHKFTSCLRPPLVQRTQREKNRKIVLGLDKSTLSRMKACCFQGIKVVKITRFDDFQEINRGI